MAAFKAADRAKLREYLTTRFSLSELQTLTFDLGISYEQLPHNTLTDFARELIAYCDRTNQLIDLIEGAIHERKDAEVARILQELKSGISTNPANTNQTGQSYTSTAGDTAGQSAPKTASGRALRVFLCHSSGDKPKIRELYHRLQADGVQPWLDEEDLIPGQNWDMEIRKAVQKSDIVVVCLSQSSVTKEGYVNKEIKFALDRADEKPEGTIFLIPLKLETCELPFRLQQYHAVSYYDERGYEKLLAALTLRVSQIQG